MYNENLLLMSEVRPTHNWVNQNLPKSIVWFTGRIQLQFQKCHTGFLHRFSRAIAKFPDFSPTFTDQINFPDFSRCSRHPVLKMDHKMLGLTTVIEIHPLNLNKLSIEYITDHQSCFLIYNSLTTTPELARSFSTSLRIFLAFCFCFCFFAFCFF